MQNDYVKYIIPDDELTISNFRIFQNEILAIVDLGKDIVIDFTNVTYIDSSGIGVIVNTFKKANTIYKTKTHCINVGARVLETLSMLHLDNYISVNTFEESD